MPNATPRPRRWPALLGTLGGLQQSLNELVTLNNQALEQAASGKSLTADEVKATNEGIGTGELIEGNEKLVKAIYLSTLAKDIDEFSTDEAAQLFDIANQCPMVGGNAVYRARSLYALIDDDVDFDDPTLCLAHGILVRSMEQADTRTVQVMPNPAADGATLVYQLTEGSTGTLLMHDAVGKEVLRLALNSGMQRFYFSTATLAPGAYHYLVLEGQAKLGEGKLTIVR